MTGLKIKKGDKVKVTTGKDKGKTGEVVSVIPKLSKLVVSGVNTVKKHTKPSQMSEGGIIQKDLPIHVSNVMYIEQEKSTPTKLGYKTNKAGKKVRYSKKTKQEIA